MKTYKELVEGINETLSFLEELEEVDGLHEDLGKHLAHAVNHLAIAQIGDVSRPSRNMKKYHAAVEKVRQSHGEKAAKDFHAHADDDAYQLHGSGPGERGTQFHKHMSDSEKKSYEKHFTKLMGEEVEQTDEALRGNQHKIDANKNGKVDGHDFKILRNQKKARYQ